MNQTAGDARYLKLTGGNVASLKVGNNDVCTRWAATIIINVESGFTITNDSAVCIAPGVFYVIFTVQYYAEITTKYKKMSSNGVTIDYAVPWAGQVLAGAAHGDGATVTLVRNTTGNWWLGVPTRTISASEKIYFSGILRTS